MVVVRVFTHPACISCSDALEVARDVAEERDDVEVSLTSLASERGRERAQAAGVLVVPAVEVGEEVLEGVPEPAELEGMIARAGG